MREFGFRVCLRVPVDPKLSQTKREELLAIVKNVFSDCKVWLPEIIHERFAIPFLAFNIEPSYEVYIPQITLRLKGEITDTVNNVRLINSKNFSVNLLRPQHVHKVEVDKLRTLSYFHDVVR